MRRRFPVVVLVIAALLCCVLGSRRRFTSDPPAIRRPSPQQHSAPAARVNRTDANPPSPELPSPSRAEIVAFLQAKYREEQLTRELDLEQQGYRSGYWEAELDGAAWARLEEARAAMLRQLNAEANEVLKVWFPAQAGEAIALTPFFDRDHRGPNLSFLSPEMRREFERQMLAENQAAPLAPGALLAIAEQTLPAPALAAYRRWNAPTAAALRDELAGFAPTEAEFAAILDARTRTAGNFPAELENRLGAERFAALQAVTRPPVSSALHDLRRLGLPLDHASWLMATRADASAAIQHVWQSDTPDGTKRTQVAQLEQAYSQAISARLGVRASSLDELAPLP